MEGAMYYNSVMKLCDVQDGGAGLPHMSDM